MATLPYTQVAIAGTAPGMTPASGGGDKVAPNDRGFLLVRNGSGSLINVTIAVPGNTRYGQPNPDPVVAVPAGADRLIGPFPSDLGDIATDGLVAIAYSGVTTVTVAALQL